MLTSSDRITLIWNDDWKNTFRDVVMDELRCEPRTNQHGCLASGRFRACLYGRPRRSRTLPSMNIIGQVFEIARLSIRVFDLLKKRKFNRDIWLTAVFE